MQYAFGWQVVVVVVTDEKKPTVAVVLCSLTHKSVKLAAVVIRNKQFGLLKSSECSREII